MTKGDAGQNISKFASSSTEASKISTSLPYISYVDLADWLSVLLEHAMSALASYFASYTLPSSRSARIIRRRITEILKTCSRTRRRQSI